MFAISFTRFACVFALLLLSRDNYSEALTWAVEQNSTDFRDTIVHLEETSRSQELRPVFLFLLHTVCGVSLVFVTKVLLALEITTRTIQDIVIIPGFLLCPLHSVAMALSEVNLKRLRHT
jgi:hypothetical protein